MFKKHNKHGPWTWLLTAVFLLAGLLALPAARPVYADGDTGGGSVQTAYSGFSAVSDVKVNNVSVKKAGYYHIAFNGNGGNGSIDTITLAMDETRNLPKNVFTHNGYTFTGWKGSDGKTYSDQQSVKNLTDKSDATITMTAQWSANTYTATFNLNYDANTASVPKFADGSKNSITRKTDQKLGTLPTTERKGYTFLGWYTDPIKGSEISADTAMSPNDVTYYAHWEIVTYQIRYSTDHGHQDETWPTSYTVEDTVKIDVPVEDSEGTVREGNTTYYFTGWSMSGQGGYSYHLTIPRGTTGNKLLSATWSTEGFRVVCKAVSQDARGHASSWVFSDAFSYKFEKPGTVISSSQWETPAISSTKFISDTSTTVKAGQDNIVYKLYESTGWPVVIDDRDHGPAGTLSFHITYCDITTGQKISDAEAEAKGYTVSYTATSDEDLGLGYYRWGYRIMDQAQAADGNSYLAKGDAIHLPAGAYYDTVTFVPKNGGTLKSWSENYTHSGNSITTSLSTADILQGKADSISSFPTMRYHINGATTAHVEINARVLNWSQSSGQFIMTNQYDPTGVITSIRWTLNGKTTEGTWHDFNAAVSDVPYGSKLSIDKITCDPSSGYGLSFYDLRPWDSRYGTYDQADSLVGKTFTIDQAYRMYIVVASDAYTIRFDANGGSGSMSNLYVDKSKGASVPACGFSNQFADFLGWSTNPDGDSMDDVEFKAGDKIPGSLTNAGNVKTLYAIWKWKETDSSGAKRQTMFDVNE